MATATIPLNFKSCKLTCARLRQVLNYNPDTGYFIWRSCTGSRAIVGRRAGCLTKNGYIEISVDGYRYYAHRLAWLYMTEEWAKEIDHINLTRSDNRIANLRLAEHRLNTANSPVRIDNTSGYKGVSWSKQMWKWESYITVNSRRINLGRFSNREDARSAYWKAAEKYFGEFAREG